MSAGLRCATRGHSCGGQNPCFDYKLADADAATPGVQPDCRATLLTPVASSGSPQHVESEASLPTCPAGATSATVTMDCWRVDVDLVQCPNSGQRITLVHAAATTPPLDPGVQLKLQCLTCPVATTGPGVAAGCAY